jgi:hypothetical protein
MGGADGDLRREPHGFERRAPMRHSQGTATQPTPGGKRDAAHQTKLFVWRVTIVPPTSALRLPIVPDIGPPGGSGLRSWLVMARS